MRRQAPSATMRPSRESFPRFASSLVPVPSFNVCTPRRRTLPRGRPPPPRPRPSPPSSSRASPRAPPRETTPRSAGTTSADRASRAPSPPSFATSRSRAPLGSGVRPSLRFPLARRVGGRPGRSLGRRTRRGERLPRRPRRGGWRRAVATGEARSRGVGGGERVSPFPAGDNAPRVMRLPRRAPPRRRPPRGARPVRRRGTRRTRRPRARARPAGGGGGGGSVSGGPGAREVSFSADLFADF